LEIKNILFGLAKYYDFSFFLSNRNYNLNSPAPDCSKKTAGLMGFVTVACKERPQEAPLKA
jgi:hypothetical protein